MIRLADHLTVWEQHGDDSMTFHRTFKRVLLQSVNSFVGVFYIAFIDQDTDVLVHTLSTILLTRQMMDNMMECVIPYVHMMVMVMCKVLADKGTVDSFKNVKVTLTVFT